MSLRRRTVLLTLGRRGAPITQRASAFNLPPADGKARRDRSGAQHQHEWVATSGLFSEPCRHCLSRQKGRGATKSEDLAAPRPTPAPSSCDIATRVPSVHASHLHDLSLIFFFSSILACVTTSSTGQSAGLSITEWTGAPGSLHA